MHGRMHIDLSAREPSNHYHGFKNHHSSLAACWSYTSLVICANNIATQHWAKFVTAFQISLLKQKDIELWTTHMQVRSAHKHPKLWIRHASVYSHHSRYQRRGPNHPCHSKNTINKKTLSCELTHNNRAVLRAHVACREETQNLHTRIIRSNIIFSSMLCLAPWNEICLITKPTYNNHQKRYHFQQHAVLRTGFNLPHHLTYAATY